MCVPGGASGPGHQHGDVHGHGNGSIKAHPATTILNQALAQMRAFMVEFGMTPSARVRVAPPKRRELSEFQQHLARKNRQAEQTEERAA